MRFTNEDVELVEKFIKIRNRGMYADGKQLTDVYNRVLEKNVHVTSCGSCLRQRVSELEKALNKFKEQIAIKAEHEKEVKKEEENGTEAKPSGTPKKGKKGKSKTT